jgi:uncharacterized membrane protein
MGTKHKTVLSSVLVALLLWVIVPALAFGDDSNDATRTSGPERGIGIFTEYPGVTVGQGESVRMDLILLNKGRSDETIDVKVTTAPKGWKVALKGGNYDVSGLYVPPGKSKNIALALDPDKNTGPGKYLFGFEAHTADGKHTAATTLAVVVQKKSATAEDIQITTSYPVLKGPTDSKFEFSLEVLNKSEADRTFNIVPSGPQNWEFGVKPAYEEKQISSLRIKGGQSQTVAVQVTPAKDAAAGQYPVTVQVTSGEKKAEVQLLVVLTGIYKLDAATTNDLLSLEAVAGRLSRFSFVVKNSGSAVNNNISFDSFKPENWTVEFKPEKIEALQPGEVKQVEVTVKPSAQALVGDYSLGVSINGEKTSKTLEMRVTVKSSAAWAWVSIGIILLVIAGLTVLFIAFGRR